MDKKDLRKIVKEEIQKVLKEGWNDREPFDEIPATGFGNKIPSELRSSRYLFTVANDDEGRERIKRAKEALAPYFRFQLQGRHHNRKEVLGSDWKSGGRNNVPLAKAEYLAVYVDAKQ